MQEFRGEIPPFPKKDYDHEYESRLLELDARELDLDARVVPFNRLTNFTRDGEDRIKSRRQLQCREAALLDREVTLHNQRRYFDDEGVAGTSRQYLSVELDRRELELDADEKEIEWRRLQGQIQTKLETYLREMGLEVQEKDLEWGWVRQEIRTKLLMDIDKLLTSRELEVARRERAFNQRVMAWRSFRAVEAVGLKEFTLFSSLPAELRLKIWTLQETPYDHPRIHSIRGFPVSFLESKKSTSDDMEKFDTDLKQIRWPGIAEFSPMAPKWNVERVVFLSPHPIHPILHVCRESRNHALKKFNLTFDFETFINFEKDTIFMDASTGITYEELEYIGALSCEALSKSYHGRDKVRSLALHSAHSAEVFSMGFDPWWFLKQVGMLEINLSAMKEVVVVHRDDRGLMRTDGNANARESIFVDHPDEDDPWGRELSAPKPSYEEGWEKLVRFDDPDWMPPTFRHVYVSMRANDETLSQQLAAWKKPIRPPGG